MKINYVISSYPGVGKRSYSYPLVEDTLKLHLEKLHSLAHGLSQITLMKPSYDGEPDDLCSNYYRNIEAILCQFNVPVQILECENYGYSGGQFLTAYETFRDQFDYYLFVEDDYCPNIPNFDRIIIDCYRIHFPANRGFFCTLAKGSKNHNQGHPVHWEGLACFSAETLSCLYQFERWQGDPRKFLLRFDESDAPSFNKKYKQSSFGGYCQLAFSHLFTLSGIEHRDSVDLYYDYGKDRVSLNPESPAAEKFRCIYWNDDARLSSGGELSLYDSRDKNTKNRPIESLDDIKFSLLVPVQVCNERGIKLNLPELC